MLVYGDQDTRLAAGVLRQHAALLRRRPDVDFVWAVDDMSPMGLARTAALVPEVDLVVMLLSAGLFEEIHDPFMSAIEHHRAVMRVNCGLVDLPRDNWIQKLPWNPRPKASDRARLLCDDEQGPTEVVTTLRKEIDQIKAGQAAGMVAAPAPLPLLAPRPETLKVLVFGADDAERAKNALMQWTGRHQALPSVRFTWNLMQMEDWSRSTGQIAAKQIEEADLVLLLVTPKLFGGAPAYLMGNIEHVKERGGTVVSILCSKTTVPDHRRGLLEVVLPRQRGSRPRYLITDPDTLPEVSEEVGVVIDALVDRKRAAASALPVAQPAPVYNVTINNSTVTASAFGPGAVVGAPAAGSSSPCGECGRPHDGTWYPSHPFRPMVGDDAEVDKLVNGAVEVLIPGIIENADKIEVDWVPIIKVPYGQEIRARAAKRIVEILAQRGIRTSDKLPASMADASTTVHVLMADLLAWAKKQNKGTTNPASP